MATRRRRMTAAQRRACLRNLRKARAALRRKKYHKIRVKGGQKGARLRKFRAELRALEGEGYSAMSNPRRKGKKRSTKSLHKIRVKAGKKGSRIKKFRRELRAASGITKADLDSMNVDQMQKALAVMSDDDYINASNNPLTAKGRLYRAHKLHPRTGTNPFRKGKLRTTTRAPGTIFKRKGKTYIVTRLRNGVKVARHYVRKGRK